jgi:hypothetical protein
LRDSLNYESYVIQHRNDNKVRLQNKVSDEHQKRNRVTRLAFHPSQTRGELIRSLSKHFQFHSLSLRHDVFARYFCFFFLGECVPVSWRVEAAWVERSVSDKGKEEEVEEDVKWKLTSADGQPGGEIVVSLSKLEVIQWIARGKTFRIECPVDCSRQEKLPVNCSMASIAGAERWT